MAAVKSCSQEDLEAILELMVKDLSHDQVKYTRLCRSFLPVVGCQVVWAARTSGRYVDFTMLVGSVVVQQSYPRGLPVALAISGLRSIRKYLPTLHKPSPLHNNVNRI